MGLIKGSKPAATTNHKDTADAAEQETKTATEAQLEKIAAEEAEYAEEDAQAEAEAQAEKEAAEKEAKAQAAAKAKAQAEAKAKKEAEAKAQAEAEAQSETETEEEQETEKVNDTQENVVADQEVIEGELVKEEAEKKTEIVERKSTEVAKGSSNNQVIAAAQDEGFGGIELGFGSFPVVKLVNEGVFNDSDENDLGKKFIATLEQSSEVFLYKQEGRDDGDVGYSYDGINLSAYNGDEEFTTVAELKQAWEEEDYDLETKKYLEVIVTLGDDQAELLGVDEIEEGLEDLEGEPVVLSLPPSAVKAFSGKIATLAMKKQPVKGSKMQFEVGKKRKNGNNTYFPWKFKLVK